MEEFVPRHSTILVLVCSFYHVLEVFLSEVFAKLMRDSSQILHSNEASPFGVEETKDVVDIFPGVLFDESWREQMDELFESDVACAFRVQIDDHLIDRAASSVRPECRKRTLEL